MDLKRKLAPHIAQPKGSNNATMLLNMNNTLLNNINYDDIETRTSNNRKKKQKIIQPSPRVLEESYHIQDNTLSTSSSKENISRTEYKKTDSILQKSPSRKLPTLTSSNIPTMNDSFECIEDTQVLISRSDQSNTSSKNLESPFLKKAKKLRDDFKARTQILLEDDLHYFSDFNEAVLNSQLDTIISSQVNNKNNENSVLITNYSWNNTQGNNKDNENSVLVTMPNDSWKNSQFSGITQLFDSSQYRRETNELFDNLETTICEMGTNNTLGNQTSNSVVLFDTPITTQTSTKSNSSKLLPLSASSTTAICSSHPSPTLNHTNSILITPQRNTNNNTNNNANSIINNVNSQDNKENSKNNNVNNRSNNVNNTNNYGNNTNNNVNNRSNNVNNTKNTVNDESNNVNNTNNNVNNRSNNVNSTINNVNNTSNHVNNMGNHVNNTSNHVNNTINNTNSKTKNNPLTHSGEVRLLENSLTNVTAINKALTSAEQSILAAPGEEICWRDETILANALVNFTTMMMNGGEEEDTQQQEEQLNDRSFGALIKKALKRSGGGGGERVSSVGGAKREMVVAVDGERRERCREVVLGPFYGLPVKVKELIALYKGIDQLYDWQDECLNLPAIKERRNLVYALPTSGGKTLVAEILILRELLCRRKNVLFVLPYVSIVQEKVWALSPFAVALDFLVEEFAAGKGSYPPRKRRRKNSVYVATMEKALGLLDSLIETDRVTELGLIVVDELHLIGDDSRGSVLETLLTKVRLIKERIQVVGMSATIGNIDEICTYLNADVYTKNFRPVELIEYIKIGDEIAKINSNVKDPEELFTPIRKLNFGYSTQKTKLDPDRIGGLVMEVVPTGSCLIFCASKKNCENVAFLLSKILDSTLKDHKLVEKQALKNAIRTETGALCTILETTINFGVAYHHSGLTFEERRLLEESFRQGVLCVICCTSTLAAGVNLPAKRVILRAPYIGRDFISLSRYKQMVGRAGRAGLGESGESITICQPADLTKLTALYMSPMDVALSSMVTGGQQRGLRHFLLSCISLRLGTSRGELQEIVQKTLLHIQRERLGLNVKLLTDQAIGDLFKLGALEIDDNKIQRDTGNITVKIDTTQGIVSPQSGLTAGQSTVGKRKPKTRLVLGSTNKLVISKMGKSAIKSGLELSRAHMLYEDLLQAQTSLVLLDNLHLLYLVTPYDISDQITPSKPLYSQLFSQLGIKELQTAKIIGLTESIASRMMTNQTINNVPDRVLKRFYVTLMLYDLWNEHSVYYVADKYQVSRGLIQNLMTVSATFASSVVSFCQEHEEFWAFTFLLRGMSQRLSHCCIKELLPLMELPSVKQNRAMQLFNAGFKTLQSIAKADPSQLMLNIEYMSRKIANQLIAAAKLILLEKVENLREEAQDVLDGADFV